MCVCVCRKDSKVSVERVNFRQFVRTLARFRRATKGHEHTMNSRDKKIECKTLTSDPSEAPVPLTLSSASPVVFQVYDTDRDGAISQEDLKHILHIMVGLHIPPEQVRIYTCTIVGVVTARLRPLSSVPLYGGL